MRSDNLKNHVKIHVRPIVGAKRELPIAIKLDNSMLQKKNPKIEAPIDAFITNDPTSQKKLTAEPSTPGLEVLPKNYDKSDETEHRPKLQKVVAHRDDVKEARICPSCKKVFAKKSSRDGHIRKGVCTKTKKAFSCTYCNKKFNTKYHKDLHMKSCVERTCLKRNKQFDSKRDRDRHADNCTATHTSVVKQRGILCEYCSKSYTRRKNRDLHMKNCPYNPTILGEIQSFPTTMERYKCQACDETFPSRSERTEHEVNKCQQGTGIFTGLPVQRPWTIKEKSSTLQTFFKYVLTPEDPEALAEEQMLKAAINDLEGTIKQFIEQYKAAKVNIMIAAKFNKASDPDTLMHDHAYLRAPMPIACYKTTNIRDEILIPLYLEIIKGIDSFEGVGSGWNLLAISFIELDLNVFTPLL